MDLDELPVYKEENKEYLFSGKRVKRGLYETKEGKYINADLNGALNIYRKSSVCDMEVISNLIRRGVSTPKRLQIIWGVKKRSNKLLGVDLSTFVLIIFYYEVYIWQEKKR